MTTTKELNRRYQRWTEQEIAFLRGRAGSESIPEIARKIGRTPDSVLKRLSRLGVQPRRESRRAIGMTAREVARALGVTEDVIGRWCRTGKLRTHRAPGAYRPTFAIDPDDLIAFLETGYCLHAGIAPTDSAWREIIQEARARCAARLINTDTLCDALALARNTLTECRQRYNFPAPVVAVASSRGKRAGRGAAYYDRAAVRAWLVEHPQYQTRAVRALLEMD